ncbi:uncharacterized protein ACOB8E_002941 isoform 4-T4 [Sarcophilus harrisii]
MAGLRRKLEFFYDLLSPYCWLSFEVLCRYRNIWNINLQLRPTFLAGIMKDTGMEESVKDAGSLDAMRFLCSVEMENPEMLEKVSRELWMRIWSQDEDITEPKSILIAAEKAGFSEEQAEFLLKKCSTEEVKKKLRETTTAACRHGAFGLPTIVFNVNKKSHMFFGSDKLELLAHLIGSSDSGLKRQASFLLKDRSWETLEVMWEWIPISGNESAVGQRDTSPLRAKSWAVGVEKPLPSKAFWSLEVPAGEYAWRSPGRGNVSRSSMEKVVKPLTLLCCASIILGFILMGLQPDIKPVAYFFFTIGGLFLLICLFCFIEWGFQANRTDTTNTSSSARDNAAFEIPSYEEAVVSPQDPNSNLGEPPPYSTVIPSGLQEEESNHLAGVTEAGRDSQGRSEGTTTQTEGSLTTPNSLHLQGHIIGSTAPPVQSLTQMEPLTPPPAYELRPNNQDIDDDNVFDDDSVFYEEGWTPP